MEDEDLIILHKIYMYIWYHVCWWLGNAKSHVINCRGIDLILPEYSGFSEKELIAYWTFVSVMKVGTDLDNEPAW